MPARSRRPALETSPLEEPSTWQLRFGRKPVANQSIDGELRVHAETRDRPHVAASIADQLLQSLAAREHAGQPDAELSRACADQLLGKRNAFASDIRMDGTAATELARLRDCEDVAAAAKEIIRSRMQVEDQAEALRRAGQRRGRSGSEQTSSRSAPSAAERLRLLRVAQTRRERELKAEAAKAARVQHATCGGVGEVLGNPEDEGEEPNNKVLRINRRLHPSHARPKASQRTGTAGSRAAPPGSDPVAQMEQRQARIRERREARRLQSESVAGRRETNSPITTLGNEAACGGESSEEKKLRERVARLSAENQHAVELAERVRSRKQQWETKSAAFGVWKRLLLARQDCATHALAVFRWRTLRRFMASWRSYCIACRRERIASESRARCVREQHLLARADAFARKVQLPRWFYRWAASATASRERRMAQVAAQRRRQQAQRLMERLVRGPESAPLRSGDLESDGEPPEYETPTIARGQPTALAQRCTSATVASRLPTRSTVSAPRGQGTIVIASRSRAACPSASLQGASDSSPSPGPPPPPTSARPTVGAPVLAHASASAPADSIYVSMLERAGERKERRQVLRRKYECAQQEKRETLAMQIEDRAAALMRVKEAERQRVRDKKREAAAAARAKQERLELAAELLHRARAANRLRLLRYYAFDPWKFLFNCRQRVSRYAQAWHEMREMHACWLRWQSLVAARRSERLAEASRHYEASVRYRVWTAWKSRLQRLENLGAAVERSNELSVATRAWKQWRRRLACERASQSARQAAVEQEMERKRLHRALQAWHSVAAELAAEREREIERQQLWAKVRGWLGEDDTRETL